MSASDPIGFFDSGIGGVTVLKEAVRLLPHENYVFSAIQKTIPTAIKAMGRSLPAVRRSSVILQTKSTARRS